MTTTSNPAAARGRPPALAVRYLVKRRGGFALGPIDLVVDAGAALAVLGPNGSGKATLFACLAGVLRSDAGRVALPAHAGERSTTPPGTIGYLADPAPFFERWGGALNLAFLRRACPSWSAPVAAAAVAGHLVLQVRRPTEPS